jgi:hypothetical protein
LKVGAFSSREHSIWGGVANVFRNVLENHPFWNSTDLAILPGPTDPPPACLIAIPLGAAVITPDANNGASLTAGGHIDLLQFRTALRHVGWTNRRDFGSTPTRGGDSHLCSSVVISITVRPWAGKPRVFPTLATQEGVSCAVKTETVRNSGRQHRCALGTSVSCIRTM